MVTLELSSCICFCGVWAPEVLQKADTGPSIGEGFFDFVEGGSLTPSLNHWSTSLVSVSFVAAHW